eukprot:m.190757 g.190757  ORF g.190757 m.190757 type:complete len:405 (-) comp18120_c0_seq1:2038-3252(-)
MGLLSLVVVTVLAVPCALSHVSATNAPSPAPTTRRVSWFSGGAGGWPVGTDGLNLTQWITVHRNAITGLMPCCGCWTVAPNGTFVSTGRCLGAGAKRTELQTAWQDLDVFRDGQPHVVTDDNTIDATTPQRPSHPHVRPQNDHATYTDANTVTPSDVTSDLESSTGTTRTSAPRLTVEPTGAFPTDFLMSRGWTNPGSLASAVAMMQREGWDGIGIDNEDFPPTMPPELPERFAELLGNLSAVTAAANKTLVVDVTSTWVGDIGGPSYLPGYAARTPKLVRYMDMAEYFATGHIPGGNKAQLDALKTLMPTRMAVPAVGLTEMPNHRNASCGGWPQCANVSDPRCGCIDYGWNQSSFAAFVRNVENGGFNEIDVYRQDLTPPPGTVPSIPPWLIDELAGFLARG